VLDSTNGAAIKEHIELNFKIPVLQLALECKDSKNKPFGTKKVGALYSARANGDYRAGTTKQRKPVLCILLGKLRTIEIHVLFLSS
jgi:hypothetical protein